MNIHSYSTVRNLILAAVLTIGFASSALAQERERAFFVDLNSKRATDLGTLGGNLSSANGINDAGQVVGYSETANGQYHAFITGPNGVGMTNLGLGGNYSYASGINDAGQVIGGYTAETGLFHAFITGPNGVGVTDLGTLSGLVGSYSSASGINDTGQVVGQSSVPSFPFGEEPFRRSAFFTGPNGVGMTALGTLGGYSSVASGINDEGRVVGSSETANGQYHAFITGPNGAGMTDLGTLGGNLSSANGINDAGQVVGYSETASGQYHAFITGPNGAGMTDLGTLGGDLSSATGINDAGQVVGTSTTDNGLERAFITGPDGAGMTDLTSLVNLPPGFTRFSSATAINNHGQLIAAAVVPEPETYAMLLLGLGLIGFFARRRATA